MSRRALRSPCCGVVVVAMVDVTVHPTVTLADGRLVGGLLVDTMKGIRADVGPPDLHESYCYACGEPVDVWALAGLPPPERC